MENVFFSLLFSKKERKTQTIDLKNPSRPVTVRYGAGVIKNFNCGTRPHAARQNKGFQAPIMEHFTKTGVDNSELKLEALKNKSREAELIEQFKDGNDSAFDELVLMISPKLFRVAFALLGNKQDAEEVVQDAFVRAHRAIADFRGEASFETWMHRITVNLARNRFHWNRRRGEGVNVSLSVPLDSGDAPKQEIDLPDSRMEPDKLLETLELENNIIRAMKNLPEGLRETMILRHMDDMPYEKIATLLDCKVGTVKSRLARGREMLRAALMRLDTPASQNGSTDKKR